MVKNVHGGSNAKKHASKYTKQPQQRGIRLAVEDEEIYGIITKKLGNGHMMVLTLDKNIGVTVMCHIGGKFKREIIKCFSFVLVGKREWQTVSSKASHQMVDLLEVYNDLEKNKLLKINGINWKILSSVDESVGSTIGGDDDIEFSNEEKIGLEKLIDSVSNNNDIMPNITSNADACENANTEEYNFDDI